MTESQPQKIDLNAEAARLGFKPEEALRALEKASDDKIIAQIEYEIKRGEEFLEKYRPSEPIPKSPWIPLANM